MPSINSSSIFLNAHLKNYAGKSVNIALVEEGVPTISSIKHCLTHFSCNSSPHLAKHANKIAGLIASRSYGLAPEVNLFCLNHSIIYENKFHETLKVIARRHGKIDISVHAYSGFPCPSLVSGTEASLKSCQEDDETQHLIVAAAGHDGLGLVRYPACLPYVFSVGVCQEDKMCHFSGYNKEIRKPEILVENYSYSTFEEETIISTVNGTSAGVAVVASVAALWIEKLREKKVTVTPSLLKAVLLATSIPSAYQDTAILPKGNFLNAENEPIMKELIIEPNQRYTIRLSVLKTGLFTCVLVADYVISRTVKFRPQPELQLFIKSHHHECIKKAVGWVSANLELAENNWIEVTITSRHPIKGSLVMTNVLIENNQLVNKPKKKSLTILGLSSSHDASACIIKDGHLLSAIQLERITRLKRDGVGYLNTPLAGYYCLDSLQLRLEDVDYFAYNNQPLIPDYVGLSMPTHDEQFTLFDPFSKKAFFVSHHLAHAYSAFFCSPFEEAVVLVADGSGGSVHNGDDLILPGNELQNYLSQKLENRPPIHVLSCYLFIKNKVELIYREYADSFNVRCGSKSLGETYAAVSQYIFGNWHDSGKLMGLAPYGNHEEYGSSLLEEDSNGVLHFSHLWKNAHRNNSYRKAMANRNLAARIQADFEKALLQRIGIIKKKTKLKNLCYSGGLALNSIANEKIISTRLFENVYFFPASNDSGVSVGSAAAVKHYLTKELKKKPVTNMFLGHPYSHEDYHFAIQKYLKYIHYEQVTPKLIAQYLAEGNIFGLFQKGCEFGPRALGHRSIIADPRFKSVWQFINKRIKYREDFRPYAPAIIKEAASRFFDIEGESPYMLRIVGVKEEFRERLQAITHVNGSARLQTVDESNNPLFYQILKNFGEITSYPILVNTSFNIAGYPIVEKPEEAIEMLLCSHLDGLLFENTLVKPNKITDISSSSNLLLAPDLKLSAEITHQTTKYLLTSSFRGRMQMKLTERQFAILNHLNKQKNLQDIYLNTGEKKWLTSMGLLNFLYQQSEVKKNESI